MCTHAIGSRVLFESNLTVPGTFNSMSNYIRSRKNPSMYAGNFKLPSVYIFFVLLVVLGRKNHAHAPFHDSVSS